MFGHTWTNNMKTFKTLTIFLLLSPFVCFAQSDSTTTNSILTKFEKYAASHLTEKAYLHFDRPYYAAGDTMYFKAYLTLGGTHELSALSGVLHVELIDNVSNKAIQSEKLEVTNGVAWGDFALPDSLVNGSYRVRAYTQLMRNNGPDAFFEQNIPIVPVLSRKAAVTTTKTPTATTSATATQSATASQKPDIQFFPEGGTLVNGIRSKIAFKAVNTNGLGIAVKGEVADHNGKTICSFSSVHLGMGSFYLTPVLGEVYKARVTYGNGIEDVVSLPPAVDNGISLSAINDSTLVASVNITANAGYLKGNKGKTYLLAVYSGGTMTTIPCRLDSSVVTVLLYKRKLHTGITRLTLFSPGQEPLCERLLFVNNDDQLKLTISTDKPVYAKGEKVTVKLNALTAKGLPAQGDFSVSVTDAGKVPIDSNNESTIVNYLLLTSELKGYIEQPNYYFNQNTYEAFSNLDLLMLTQGYRSFEWKAVLNNDTTAKFQPEKLLSLSGTVENLSGKPVPNAEVSLGAIRQLIARDTTADNLGRFSFSDLYITDTAKLLLKAGKGNKSWKVQVDPPDVPAISKLTLTDTTTLAAVVKPSVIAEMKKAYLQSGNMHTGIMLKEVKIHEDKNPLHLMELVHSDNLNGAGIANQVIMGDKLVGCPTVADCLEYLLLGVRISAGTRGPIFYSNRSSIELNGHTKPMAVEINGIITDQSVLNDINPQDIYSIEVLESAFYLTIYGSHATGGLLVVTLRRGDERNLATVQPGLTTYIFKGFYKSREFYSPLYDTKTPEEDRPNIRTTLFWKPVLITDKDGNVSFDFYTSDKVGNDRIVVEGISDTGNLCRLGIIIRTK